MKRVVLQSKTGQMNMGGYFTEKTARLDRMNWESDKHAFRVYYLGDSCDECFSSIESATKRFNEISTTLFSRSFSRIL